MTTAQKRPHLCKEKKTGFKRPGGFNSSSQKYEAKSNIGFSEDFQQATTETFWLSDGNTSVKMFG